MGELPRGRDNAYCVVPSGGRAPGRNATMGGPQYQQFDVYAFHSNVKSCYQLTYDALAFLNCLSCLTQATASSEYRLVGTEPVGGVTDLGKTVENRHMTKFSVEITYLTTC